MAHLPGTDLKPEPLRLPHTLAALQRSAPLEQTPQPVIFRGELVFCLPRDTRLMRAHRGHFDRWRRPEWLGPRSRRQPGWQHARARHRGGCRARRRGVCHKVVRVVAQVQDALQLTASVSHPAGAQCWQIRMSC